MKHIFLAADGHFPEDTPEARRAMLRVARNPAYRLGGDRFAVIWAEETMVDGTQVWVQVRNGRIINGGINPQARNFNLITGVSAARGMEKGCE